MKSPICEICLKSGILCTACQSKVDQGSLKNADIEILRMIYKEVERNKALGKIEIKKIIEGEAVLLVVCSQGDAAKIVGKGGFFAKKLSEAAKKTVRVVEASEDARAFLQNIVFPVPIISLNVLYTPEGDKYRIMIPQNSRLPFALNAFKSLAKDLLGKEVDIGFEDRPRAERRPHGPRQRLPAQ